MSGAKIAGASAVCIVIAIAALAISYDWQVTTSCSHRPKNAQCERPEPDIINDLFFATQTVTTTGYGSGVNVAESKVQIIASIGSVFGSIFWALLTAGMFASLASAKRTREAGH